MQTVVNKALKFINCNEDNELTVAQLHTIYNITPLNISIFQRSQKTWEAVRVTEPEHYNKLITNNDRDHNWFPKTSKIINEETPEPIITREQ